MAVSKSQPMRPAEIDLVDAVNGLQESTEDYAQDIADAKSAAESAASAASTAQSTAENAEPFVFEVKIDLDSVVTGVSTSYETMRAALVAGRDVLCKVNTQILGTYYVLTPTIYSAVFVTFGSEQSDDSTRAARLNWREGDLPEFSVHQLAAASPLTYIDSTLGIDMDTAPTADSANPVTSGGIKTALDSKQDALSVESPITLDGSTLGFASPAVNAKNAGDELTMWRDTCDDDVDAGDGYYSHADSNGTANGTDCHADSYGTTNGTECHADSYGTANGSDCHADSYGTANGSDCHADSYGTVEETSSDCHADSAGTVGLASTECHADSGGTVGENGTECHADSGGTVGENGTECHADSGGTVGENGYACHADSGGTAYHSYSRASGIGTIADGYAKHASGMFSERETTNWAANTAYAVGDRIIDSGLTYICKTAHTSGSTFSSANWQMEDATHRGKYAFVIGNGTSNTARSNAIAVDWEGNSYQQGDVTCDATQGNHENLYSLRAIGAIVASTPSFEHGTSNSVTVSANSHTVVDITFGSAKTEIPVVFPAIQCPTAGVNLIATVQSVSNSQCAICVTNLGTTDVSDVTVDYLAVYGR